MKKFLLIIFLFSITTLMYSEDTHNISVGIDFPLLSETVRSDGMTQSSTLTGWGISFSGYSFWNDMNVGLMSSGSIDFPQKVKDDLGNIAYTDMFDFNMMLNLLFGAGFRSNPDKNIQFYGGAGIHFMSYNAFIDTYAYFYSLEAYNLGLGVDLNGKIDLSESFYLLLGTSLFYDFFNTTKVSDGYHYVYGDYDSYIGLWFIPRLEIGFQYFRN
ncbi:MAG: hypothetical protein PQJ58_07755 [Spirochaetales bacterium]|nr:hypothetical protein [Spirochaetales bacterium]